MTILAEKDVNIKPKTHPQGAGTQTDKMEHSMQRQAIMKSTGQSESGCYISPSDAIMSPASKKLANFKQHQINKQSNQTRRTLFARTASTASSAASEEPAGAGSAS